MEKTFSATIIKFRVNCLLLEGGHEIYLKFVDLKFYSRNYLISISFYFYYDIQADWIILR